MKKEIKGKKMVLDGNGAVAEALKLARVSVIAVYPITPQSPIAERLAEMVNNNEMQGKYICVESEHSALSYTIGAQLTGVRAATATSSVGLALMHEVMGVASGCRVPVVMPVVNRALVSPWSLWCDHQDSMAERDSGWMQLYAEDAQEAFDLVIMGYKIAEHENILLPLMVCMDGFFVSHSNQPVWIPEQNSVDIFLPEYSNKNLYLDTEYPMFINNLTPPEEFTEMRYQQEVAFQNALNIIPVILKEYETTFGRKYGLIEAYKCEDAAVVIAGMGSMCGTIKHVVNKFRDKNINVGMIKITVFRPLPAEKLREALMTVSRVGVIDRSAGLGAENGPLCLEIKSALSGEACSIHNYIIGLGGRDITEEIIEEIFNDLLSEGQMPGKNWIDKRDDAQTIRRY